MPSNSSASPVKRPGGNQRSVSSYAVPTRQAPPAVTADLSHSHKAPAHKFRPHVVGAQRTHARNPSYNKSQNKLQKLAAAHNPGVDGATSSNIRNQQDKKSSQPTVATSPSGQTHVRRNGSTGSLTGQTSNTSMKKNLSTPALRRNGTIALGKKSNISGRPPAGLTGERKKTVGFELGNSDSDDEWEDNNSSHSPESTRRNSMAAIKASLEPLPSLDPPKSDNPPNADNQDPSKTNEHMPSTQQEKLAHSLEHDASTPRFLSRPRSSKAPPTMSSVSAVASSPAINRSGPSLTNISARRNFQSTNPPPTAPNSFGAPTPGANRQGTSSSIEGGVSRFLSNDDNDNDNDNVPVGSRSGSDPNTPSSLLPHYHLQRSPSSQQSANSKRTKSRAGEPHSRTQQKLWLQRTATLATSPPDHSLHGMSSAIPPSAIEPVFRTMAHSRSTSQFSTPENSRSRGGNGGAGGGMANGTDSKQIRRIDEGLVSELFVVRRFRTPVLDSLNRVDEITRATSSDGNKTAEQRELSSAGNFQSAPALTNGHSLQTSRKNTRNGAVKAHNSEVGVNQYITKNTNHSTSRVHFHDQDDMVNIGEPAAEQFSESPSDRLLSMAGPDGTSGEEIRSTEHGKERKPSGVIPSESDMMIRRLWDTREIGVAGD